MVIPNAPTALVNSTPQRQAQNVSQGNNKEGWVHVD